MFEYSREFIVLASHLNFTTAAKELHISQPGLSRHIAELEKEVGFQLVSRSPVTLTPAGKSYLHGIMPIIRQVDELLVEGRSISRNTKERIVIRKPALEGRATQVSIEAVNLARKIDPFVEFVIKEDRKISTIDSIAKGDADIGFVYKDIDSMSENIVCELLFEEPFHLWLHRDNPLSKKKPLLFEDMKSLNLVCSANRRCEDWNSGVRAVYRKRGMEPTYRVKDLNNLSDFLQDLQPDETLMTSPVLGSLASLSPTIIDRIPDDDPPCLYPTFIVYRKNCENSVLSRFIECCKKAASELV